MSKKTLWGYHLILDLGKCNLELMQNKEHVKYFAKEMVKSIGMKSYGEPQVVFFGEGDKSGFTLVQLISTSDITAHFSDETQNIFLDIFSCKDFDVEVAVRVAKECFQPMIIKKKFVKRYTRT